MIIFGILLTFVLLALIAWALFKLAIFALPFFVTVTAGLGVLHAGGGAIGALALGLFAGILTLVAGQLMFTLAPWTAARAATAIVFVLPAGVAGYHAAHGLMAIGAPSETWRIAIGIVGALVAGGSALARLVVPVPQARQVASARI